MKLLFEAYQYTADRVQSYLPCLEHLYSRTKDGKIIFECVGYCFCETEKDVVFVLPKVLIEETRAFGQIQPEDLIDFDNPPKAMSEEQRQFVEGHKDFIAQLAVWLYRAIMVYSSRQQNNISTISANIADVLKSVADSDFHSRTYLDIILQLFRFHKENNRLFTFVSLSQSGGINHINWNRTISKHLPLLSEDIPVYHRLETRKREIDYEDTLIGLFYSVLLFLKEKYHFSLSMNLHYALIPPHKIRQMLESGKGIRLLRSIRKNYFRDELVALWKLLYVFFDKSEKITRGRYHAEKLLVRNFNNVFEDMIDRLLSDEKESLPVQLKDQPDGKIVDHIYSDRSLIGSGEIYFIGDSKYYQDKTALGVSAVYKQFTYAKNVIQLNVGHSDVTGKIKNEKRYRDNLTEGYNITPNFFIRGNLDFNQLSGKSDGLKLSDKIHKMFQFPDRLFDRDTLLIQTYNINFLYVLEAYISRGNNAEFRQRAKNAFRQGILNYLDKNYNFYLIKFDSMQETKNFVSKNFKTLAGKMYKFDEESKDILLALEIPEENSTVSHDLKEIMQEIHSRTAKVSHLKSDQLRDKI